VGAKPQLQGNPHTGDDAKITRRWLAGIVALFLIVYAFSYSGLFRADDEHILASRAISLALRGEWEQPQVYGNQRFQTLIPFGDAATQIEPAQTVLGAALVAPAKASRLGHVQALFSLNIYATALTTGVVFLTVVMLGYSRRTSAWCTILFGLGTAAWPYTTTLYRDPVAMFFSAVAFLGWVMLHKTDLSHRMTGVGLLAGGLAAGILTKNTVVALVPSLLIYTVVRWVLVNSNAKTRVARTFLGAAVLAIILGVLGVIPATGPLARFSLDYYSGLADHFLESIGPGLAVNALGPFVSPAKSLLLFSPALILAALGTRQALQERGWFAIPVLSFALWLSIAQALFYRELWAGAAGWGLRFMLPALPALMVLAAPAIDSALQNRARRSRIALYLVGFVGGIIQLAGVLVGWNLVYRDWQSQGLDPFSTASAWDPKFNPIPGHLSHLLQPSTWTVAWYRTFGEEIAMAIAIGIGLLALAIFVLARRRLREGTAGLGGRIVAICIAAAAVVPSIPLWSIYRSDPKWGGDRPEFAEAIGHVSQGISGTDVLVIDSYATPLWGFWLNRWSHGESWFSLAFEIPDPEIDLADPIIPSDLTQALVASLESEFSRLWFVTSSDSPGYSLGAESSWLSDQFQLSSHQRFEGAASQVEVWLFDLPPS
jgi:hypothetical protein